MTYGARVHNPRIDQMFYITKVKEAYSIRINKSEMQKILSYADSINNKNVLDYGEEIMVEPPGVVMVGQLYYRQKVSAWPVLYSLDPHCSMFFDWIRLQYPEEMEIKNQYAHETTFKQTSRLLDLFLSFAV